ncbi:MAG: flagellar basal body rod protein FlgC [Candidatus Margulisbacteria bacterium GWF2_35_9]|nr:MAG: flagellar basal body rod protein FlgC [Candidatus Margulisbacteria bacterium GWF2_35_9]
MSFFSAATISGSGMSVQRQLMDLISENLANVNTIQSSDGGPYRRKIAIIGQKEAHPFGQLLGSKMQSLVQITAITRDDSPPRMDYDPTHPLADERGYVKKPNINVAMEMIRMMDASRAYEANVAVFNASKTMAAKALQIGA